MKIKNFYIQKGEGEVLILLHGNGEDSSYFAHQIEHFSRYYQVIAVDTRGHGKSLRGTAPFTIRQFALDLRRFMDEKGIDRANILGFSDGANIAMVFTIKYPNRVKNLILNGGNLNAKGVRSFVQLPIELGYRIARLFSKKSEQAKRNMELLGLMVNEPNIPKQYLSKIVARTLVIAGTKDMIKEEHTKLIANSIPNAKLVLIRGDHFIANKEPERFNTAVMNFLRDDSELLI